MLKVRKRTLAIWLPRLSIERWRKIAHAHGETPPEDARILLTREGPHGRLVHAVCDNAALVGLRAGMRLTDARALDPQATVIACDLIGDDKLMARLARWARRWSPLVERDGEDGLRLDASGVAHLFGGERALLDDIEARFAALGLSARTAIADTPLAAWALCHYAGAGSGRGELSGSAQAPPRTALERKLASGQLAALLAPLPVAALRLPPAVVRTLHRLGLKTIAGLSGIERRSLARRFRSADNPLDALDRALGRIAEPLSAEADAPPPSARLRLKEPVDDPAAARQALDLLVPELARQLEARRLGARTVELAGYRVDGSVASIAASTALATREADHLSRLLAERTERLDPEFGFDAFALTASWAEPLDPAQDALDGDEASGVAVGRLVDRIATRLGAQAVARPRRQPSHMPERAAAWAPALATVAEDPDPPPQAPRPERLLDSPEAIGVLYATPEGLPRRFVWRRAVHDIVKVEGPERIAPEWWREYRPARLRDYYRVEDQAGRGYWIFREGLFGDGRGGDPVWYIHGLFG
ncbi:DNA polymerase Y family protein [Sphingomicrobium astaxanthinifaciens]|uniref:DNA polymerase Y family protein n=1 Tax=Sphingomicrobium astaxanthinifaciens TaxID=1227949 RepID=UPI001FCB9F22|nr:DNA polymerase Y family protein [Sphingomicrobium astaxanthinifaciens]MCJ7421049.1 DNA polymerase Y family protein [Sphingomicrobium astaxanthinifaciens]